MPLHLLGKKSWNVYNADNIARVRRDEAAAEAAEEAEEQRMQEIDAQRRLAILRGEVPPPLSDKGDDESAIIEEGRSAAREAYPGTGRRKRKRAGEDDTDYELRLARERDDGPSRSIDQSRKSTSSAPIVDHAGHIDLFGDERARAHAEKNEEAEAEAKKKKREYEDRYTMRFYNAAGRSGLNKPWYSQSEGVAPDSSSKDVWGNEDLKRRERDSQRAISNDPLAMMKKGASQVRELKNERRKLQEEREEELRQLRKERHRERHGRRDERESRDDLDTRRRDSRRRRSNERSRDRHEARDDHRERRRHKEDERRRHRDSHSPERRSSHCHKGGERRE